MLILLDRNLDLKVMLSHSWSYQSLIHDIFDMKLNRIEIAVKPKTENEKSKKEHFDFDDTDPFWVAHAGIAFNFDFDFFFFRLNVPGLVFFC